MVSTRRKPRLITAALMESGVLRQSVQRGTGDAQALRGNGVVVGDQLDYLIHPYFLGGVAQHLQQGQKDCRNGGHRFDALHAVANGCCEVWS
jgi:hypothetical protein